VNHGKIVAELIEGLGANPNQYRPIKQYAFHIPLEDWIDLAWFHALIDRVGLYVGIEMTGAPYEPLAKAAPELEGDEEFHTRAGFLHLKEICTTPEGKAAAQERLTKWWPAALDMFGRSDSKTSPLYVKWGIKLHENEALRQKYIAEAIPEIRKLGLEVPDNLAHRRFL
jgi:1,2-phenylacetyl-CoA epoxidase catalytic subunit